MTPERFWASVLVALFVSLGLSNAGYGTITTITLGTAAGIAKGM